MSDLLHATVCLWQIYLSWKSGPAEVKHWKDMMGHPRTAVSQWHSLKAWGRPRSCLQCWSAPASQSHPHLQHIPTHTRHPKCRYRVSSLCSQASLISTGQILIPSKSFGADLWEKVFDVLALFLHLTPVLSFFFCSSFLHHVKQSPPECCLLPPAKKNGSEGFSGHCSGRREEFNHESDMSVNSARLPTVLLPHLSLSLFIRNLETVEKIFLKKGHPTPVKDERSLNTLLIFVTFPCFLLAAQWRSWKPSLSVCAVGDVM